MVRKIAAVGAVLGFVGLFLLEVGAEAQDLTPSPSPTPPSSCPESGSCSEMFFRYDQRDERCEGRVENQEYRRCERRRFVKVKRMVDGGDVVIGDDWTNDLADFYVRGRGLVLFAPLEHPLAVAAP